MKHDKLLSVVAPVYNELENLDQFVDEIRRILQNFEFPSQYEIILVDDGSLDGSAEKLDQLAQDVAGEITVVHLSRNFGHTAAVFAGLAHASGDAVILMDSDMQDDPAAFSMFIKKWQEGYDVVYAIRAERQENLLYRVAFLAFYRLLKWLVNINIPSDAGNFCLMDRRVVKHLQSMPERNRYFPGLRAWVGFRQIGVMVRRRRRYDTHTRVGFWGLWNLAMNAFFSFSYIPIVLFRMAGIIALMFTVFMIGFVLYHKLITGNVVPTWTSNLVTTSFLGGMNLLGIGVLGEYVARIYDEIKQRPIYIVDRVSGKIERH